MLFRSEHDFFPSIMLREVAEGGAHLDRETIGALVGVPRAFFPILEAGIEQGTLRPVHPFVAYFSVLAPIMFYLAAGPIRREVSAHRAMNVNMPTPDEFVRQLQELLRRALAQPPREGSA